MTIIDPFLAQGKTMSKKRPTLLYNALVKIKSILTRYTQAEDPSGSQSPIKAASTPLHHQPIWKIRW